MALTLKESADLQTKETDVRETPTGANIESLYQESTAAQTIANAAGFVDVTGLTKTFTLQSSSDVAIFANVQAALPTGEQKVGLQIRIDVDGVTKTNTLRASTLELYQGANAVEPFDDTDTIVTVPTMFLASKLSKGSHTIHVEAAGQNDGTSGWAVSLADARSSMLLIIK